MDAAAALHDIEGVDLHDVASRETLGDDAARFLVVAIVEGRHDHRPIGEIEVDVTRAKQPTGPREALLLGLRQFDDLKAASFGVARYTPAGVLDTTFAGVGYTATNVGTASLAQAVTVDPDGRILVAGVASDGTRLNGIVTRYWP